MLPRLIAGPTPAPTCDLILLSLVSDRLHRRTMISTAMAKSRQDLKREYKERAIPAGVFQVRNAANGKVLLGSSLNLDGPLNRHRFMLTIGKHPSESLQEEWNRYGADKFTFEILEVARVKDDPDFNLEDELTLLEQIWIEKAQPFGEKGYNKDSRIREA